MKLMTVVLMSAVLAGSGCSFAFQKHKDDGMIRSSLVDDHCTGSRTLPWLDVGIMGAGVLTAASAAAYQGGVFDHSHSSDAATTIGMVAGGAAFLFMASGIEGFKRAKACEATVAAALANR